MTKCYMVDTGRRTGRRENNVSRNVSRKTGSIEGLLSVMEGTCPLLDPISPPFQPLRCHLGPAKVPLMLAPSRLWEGELPLRRHSPTLFNNIRPTSIRGLMVTWMAKSKLLPGNMGDNRPKSLKLQRNSLQNGGSLQ